MPITQFQSEILKTIARNRNPESYVAGGTVINRRSTSPRYSNDIDLFHDPAVSVAVVSEIDLSLLSNSGYSVEILIQQPFFVRAVIRQGEHSVLLDWATDTAFRFFPAVPDEILGYRLHDVDAAVNKCLALAGRTEPRDVVDMLTIHESVLHLGACAWAACGKDPGFTPNLILEFVARNSCLTPDLLSRENFVTPPNPVELKRRWIDALDDAHKLVNKLDVAALGCVFVDSSGQVQRIPEKSHKPLRGSVRGALAVLAK